MTGGRNDLEGLLTYFRRRLQRSSDPNRLFTKVKEVVAATGVLKGKRRRALDSTVLDDAVATQDTVTQLVAAIRRVIHGVPGAEQVAVQWCTAHDYTDPGKPRIAWNDEQARSALVDALVTDALNLLGRLPERQLDEKAADAVGLLALVAGQDVEVADDSDGRDGRWRIDRGTVHDRVVSTVDTEARHIHKNRTRHQEGFRAHAACEPETGLLTEVALTQGGGQENHEAAVAEDLLADESEDLTVLGDTAYGTGDLREALEADGHTLVIKPPPLRQAVPGGFTTDDFQVDTQAGTVTCPAGHIKAPGRPPRERQPPGPVQETLPRLPPTRALYQVQDRTHLQRPPPSTTASKPPVTRPPPARNGRTSTAAGGHPSNAPSPGSSPKATAASPTEAS